MGYPDNERYEKILVLDVKDCGDSCCETCDGELDYYDADHSGRNESDMLICLNELKELFGFSEDDKRIKVELSEWYNQDDRAAYLLGNGCIAIKNCIDMGKNEFSVHGMFTRMYDWIKDDCKIDVGEKFYVNITSI